MAAQPQLDDGPVDRGQTIGGAPHWPAGGERGHALVDRAFQHRFVGLGAGGDIEGLAVDPIGEVGLLQMRLRLVGLEGHGQAAELVAQGLGSAVVDEFGM